MTPAINVAKKKKIFHKVHQYSHDPTHDSYGREAAEKLGIAEERVYKTLVVELGPQNLAVAVIPVSTMLNMKLIAKRQGLKRRQWPQKRLSRRQPVTCSAASARWGRKKDYRR